MLSLIALALLVCCTKNASSPPDHPRLTPGVIMRDVTFHNAALNRDMPYRVILPAKISSGQKLPVVYLLHGGGEGFRSWSNDSDVARFAEPHFAERGLILVMPEGHSSYYTNSADHQQERYEDYIVHDLIADVESKFPAAPGRASRAIIGVSMGGFGAVNMALKHPDLFFFAAGVSPAIDVPSRPFSIKRVDQWRHHSSIFGPWGSQTRRDNDPFVLARSAEPAKVPYLYLSCGDKEGLLPANRKFALLLDPRHLRYEFHVNPGGHDWNQWNAHLDRIFASLVEHMAKAN
ncbi:MAG: esterase family protein [Acidobacteriia bacterium]|nr:esterase family protein [Terriglobia bacterium]